MIVGEGVIQRFEYTWELAWKTLADILADEGKVIPSLTPKSVVRAAFAAEIISDGDAWMEALNARNLMSHTYDFKVFREVIVAIRQRYLALFEDLYDRYVGSLIASP